LVSVGYRTQKNQLRENINYKVYKSINCGIIILLKKNNVRF